MSIWIHDKYPLDNGGSPRDMTNVENLSRRHWSIHGQSRDWLWKAVEHWHIDLEPGSKVKVPTLSETQENMQWLKWIHTYVLSPGSQTKHGYIRDCRHLQNVQESVKCSYRIFEIMFGVCLFVCLFFFFFVNLYFADKN
jgi:hypothetical protein